MFDFRTVRDRAAVLAVKTGQSVDLDLIWEWQRQEGGPPCFGTEPHCPEMDCRWRTQCHMLSRMEHSGLHSSLAAW
jgi:hypothetical protein